MLSDGGERAQLVDWLRRDLVGPFWGEDERIRARPTGRYLIGVLQPAFTPQAVEETDETLDATADDETADVEAAYGGMKQSALGISFSTTADGQPVVGVSYAEYDPIEVSVDEDEPEGGTPNVPDDAAEAEGDDSSDATAESRREWQRRVTEKDVRIASATGSDKLADGIFLEWRSSSTDDARVWTVSLVNRRPKAGDPVFQPQIRVRLSDGGKFKARPALVTVGDPDEDLNALLYRATPEYAVGHGCAATWTEDTDVTEVRTDAMPAYQIPAVVPLANTGAELRMDALAAMPTADSLQRAVSPLLDEYDTWITATESELGTLAEDLRRTAEVNLVRCAEASSRMRAALQLMAQDGSALMAFRFMNRAMADQRRATLGAAQYRASHNREKVEEVPRWRPFQLAFILLNISGIVRPESRDRQLVDLLWFPTGGGKTEAYLGLAAFTIGYRRLMHPAPGQVFRQGVTVLTRYTLRLLTTQQFERAAALVSACELLRRQKPDVWGDAPIRIGLWVGESAAPNTFENAVQRAEEAKQRVNPNQSHPFVLRNCPWCGEHLPFPSAFSLDVAARRLRVTCTYGGCPFSKEPGLPIQVIDEEVYREPPEILLATVDKLARLPWVGQAASLFGRASYICPTHGHFSTPDEHRWQFRDTCSIAAADTSSGIDLVIQDELHLISGPLGSLVGLYEIAVEFLAARNEHPPKVVASTATIRSAVDQVRALYGRDQRLFPPPAVNAFETFFAMPAAPEERSGRLYVGLTAPGTSMKTALIRSYSSLLAGVVDLNPDESADAYWTLVGYYNSLRELGGAVSFLQDDIPSRLGSLARAREYPPRGDLQHQELTSRIPSSEIPDRLRRMERPRVSGEALDVLVATNMISVGVDVDRLGLMVVAGQPKGTAEYIQATSRVGRSYPGLVVTVYNWTRPRDLSHYESFQTYHSAIYRHVEATSVTPLSPRARDRGLHAVLVAALRLADVALTAESGASLMAQRRHEAIATAFVDDFRRRAAAAEQAEAAAAEDQLARLLDQWVERGQKELEYGRGSGSRLLKPAQSEAQEQLERPDPDAWPTLNSLRSVESEHSWFEAR
ncbi:MAG TPA: DISARM system helicase DrmA [Candidatus Limnocylindria bacterium]|nr:DISARM system helicase DrmA [Candidatus Limnocylindria bacterium]